VLAADGICGVIHESPSIARTATPYDDPSAWSGEAKLSGTAIELEPGGQPGGTYCDVTDVVLTYLDDRLIIEHWNKNIGSVRHER